MSWTTVVLALSALAGAPSHFGASGGAPSAVSVTVAVVRNRLGRRLRRRYAASRRTKSSSAS